MRPGSTTRRCRCWRTRVWKTTCPGSRSTSPGSPASGHWCADEDRDPWSVRAGRASHRGGLLAVAAGELPDPEFRRSDRFRDGVPGGPGTDRPGGCARLVVVGRLAFLRPVTWAILRPVRLAVGRRRGETTVPVVVPVSCHLGTDYH